MSNKKVKPSFNDKDVVFEKTLMDEIQCTEQEAFHLSRNGVGRVVLDLKKRGDLDFLPAQQQEEETQPVDPILIVMPFASDQNSSLYCNNGNYGLPFGTPGAMPWPGGALPVPGLPLAAGVAAAPPNALGLFISRQPGVVDISGGSLCVFKCASDGVIEQVCLAIQSTPQFRRLGPAMAGLLVVPVQPPLFHLLMIRSVAGPTWNRILGTQTV